MHTATPENRLRELRRKHKVPLHELAALLGRDQSMISRYERGLTVLPDEAKRTLAAHYGVTVAHLMGWDREGAA